MKIALWPYTRGEKPVCFVTCEGEVLWALGETRVAERGESLSDRDNHFGDCRWNTGLYKVFHTA